MRFLTAALLLLTSAICLPALAQSKVDKVVVNKSDRKLMLYAGDAVLKTYDITLGDAPEGHKQREGDERTPEGNYVLDYRNPQSKYFKSIHISYPNAADRKQAREGGYSPGGDIFIHGLPNGYGALGAAFALTDWTDGCIAVNNNEHMQEIWDLVRNGTPITILP